MTHKNKIRYHNVAKSIDQYDQKSGLTKRMKTKPHSQYFINNIYVSPWKVFGERLNFCRLLLVSNK
jgi:hypothetical protein